MKGIKFCLSLIAMLTTLAASADEGMWLVNGIDSRLASQMRRAGLRLKPSEIWNDGRSGALTDAVVAVNGGQGSGSMISADGLMITNHHVAYSGICALSTPEHNYLQEGFWAASREEEIPVEGYSVQFLRGILDVTAEADSLRSSMVAAGTWNTMSVRRMAKIMEDRYADRSEYTPSFEMMWGGKRSFIYLYERFTDVRLVAAPPERLGAFGGDTDNWGWPQHKSDFTLFRVYSSPDGKPAAYSADNVPLHPSRWLHVASKPLKEGDFTMIIGYPGSTTRYMSSWAVAEKRDVRNPVVVDARHRRMDIIREGMERNDTVRMNYSDRYFSLSNYADYAKWENICLRRFGVEQIRREEEQRVREWVAADSAREARYGMLFDRLARGHAARREAYRARCDYAERWFGNSEALLTAGRLQSAVNTVKQRGEYMLAKDGPAAYGLQTASERLHKADPTTDRRLFVEIGASFFESVPESYWAEPLKEEFAKYGGDFRAMLADVYDSSVCSSAERFDAFISEPKRIKTVMEDPMVRLASMLPFPPFSRRVFLAEREADASVAEDEKSYASLIYDYREAHGMVQYPNANSTMRLTYGKVCGLVPRDGVRYGWYSTTDGYMEKIDDTTHEFRSDSRMKEMIGSLPAPRRVNFLTDNDITGGNSGSAVLNARGEIVGLAFDGNRESMAGDIWFNPSYSRTVCVDMAHVMWILENYAPAALTAEIRRR